MYGHPETVLICAGEIMHYLHTSKIQFNLKKQEEVEFDLVKFPSSFKRIKTPINLISREDDGKENKSRKSSGIGDNGVDADLSYQHPKEISHGALFFLKEAGKSITFSAVAKSVLDTITNRIAG